MLEMYQINDVEKIQQNQKTTREAYCDEQTMETKWKNVCVTCFRHFGGLAFVGKNNKKI